ncbi:MAG: DUF421 domain-containing protein [Candidatus Desulforudis sp.]|nr:DUF421 domain-containing protein [Desulforudis sp.]
MNPLLEIILRAVGAFLAVLLITRIIGKSQIGQLTVTDFVNGIVIGSLAAALAIDVRTPAVYYFAGLAVFSGLTLSLEYLTMKSRPARKVLEDEPTVVVHNGKVLEQKMHNMRYHMDDLMMQLRAKGAFNIADVEFAVLEPNGELSVQLKSQKRPVTPADLNLPSSYEGLPSELIVDGKVIEQNLVQNNVDEEWLFRELEKKGVRTAEEVVYASLDSAGDLYVDLREDAIDHYTDTTDKMPGKIPQ